MDQGGSPGITVFLMTVTLSAFKLIEHLVKKLSNGKHSQTLTQHEYDMLVRVHDRNYDRLLDRVTTALQQSLTNQSRIIDCVQRLERHLEKLK